MVDPLSAGKIKQHAVSHALDAPIHQTQLALLRSGRYLHLKTDLHLSGFGIVTLDCARQAAGMGAG